MLRTTNGSYSGNGEEVETSNGPEESGSIMTSLGEEVGSRWRRAVPPLTDLHIPQFRAVTRSRRYRGIVCAAVKERAITKRPWCFFVSDGRNAMVCG